MDQVTYAFDIDGTICTQTEGDYENATPYRDRIDSINDLYDAGHHIIMLTARGMGRTGQNELEAYRLLYDFTLNQLNKWGVRFHKLMLGKPQADYYIDDKAIKDTEFFPK